MNDQKQMALTSAYGYLEDSERYLEIAFAEDRTLGDVLALYGVRIARFVVEFRLSDEDTE